MPMDLPIHAGTPGFVPVFDCHVLVSGPHDDGKLRGVVSNLPSVAASASDERALLQKIVKDFKATVIGYRERQEEVPWEPTREPVVGERQRWIPVHL